MDVTIVVSDFICLELLVLSVVLTAIDVIAQGAMNVNLALLYSPTEHAHNAPQTVLSAWLMELVKNAL